MPSTASTRLSQVRSGSFTRTELLSFCGELLDLGAELFERRSCVDALGARLLDPVFDDGRGELAHFAGKCRIGLHDLDVDLLQRLDADLVGAVPRLAVRARGVLVRMLLDDR